MHRTSFSAPGKVIIAGEHFVVHGSRAIAMAISMRSRATASRAEEGHIIIESKDLGLKAEWFRDEKLLEEPKGAADRLKPLYVVLNNVVSKYGGGISVEVCSELPRGAGLGSSASISVATSAAALSLLKGDWSDDELVSFASVAEEIIHYTPSGIDLAITANGGVLCYRKGEPHSKVELTKPLKLLLIDTGTYRRTGEMVRRVWSFRERHPKLFKELREAAESLVEELVGALRQQDLVKLGELMNVNHALLRAIGVSSRELDAATEIALKAGALGAKLTGGGGGGCVIAVAEEDLLEQVAERCSKRYRTYVTETSKDGVRLEG